MRKLASIKEVSNLIPIEGRDRIELAIIDGWQVIVKKGEFSRGDKCVYIEIDSVLPEKPEFEFLRSKDFRIRTMKMAGVISQGICFPLSILPEGEYELEQDVSDIIGVKQYEKTIDDAPTETPYKPSKYPKWLMRWGWFRKLVSRSNKKASRAFPDFISKTDETRLQNMPWILKNKSPMVCTEKIDGQSGTFALVCHKGLFGRKYEYIVCSRNRRLYERDDSSYWAVSAKYHIELSLTALMGRCGDPSWVAIQGECISPKVQGNKYKVTEPDFYVFNVITPQGRLGTLEAYKLAKAVGLKFVPIVNANYVLPDTVNEVLDYATGQSAIGDTLREGLVIRSQDGTTSFKAVSPQFLITYNE